MKRKTIFNYLKPLFTNGKDHERYTQSKVLDACYKYNIEPKDFVARADSDMFEELHRLMFDMKGDSKAYKFLQNLYDKKEKLKKFISEDVAIGHYQALVYTHALNNLLNLDQINKINTSELEQSSRDRDLSLAEAIDYLRAKNEALIPKSWEKDLNDYLK